MIGWVLLMTVHDLRQMLDWSRGVDNLLFSCTKREVRAMKNPFLFPFAHLLRCY
jgi:hypothetical protein